MPSVLVARAAFKTRETALRIALGASRMRLVRQSLSEVLILVVLGAVAGAFTGYVGLRGLAVVAPESLSRIHASQMHITVFAFTLAVSIAWGVLLSLAPMTDLWWFGPGRSGTPRGRLLYGRASRPGLRVRATLVVMQIALSGVLLIGAGLLARALVEVQGVDTGFATDRHLTFRVALPESRYPDTTAVLAAATALQRRLASLPGVTGAGAISHLPFDDLPNWSLMYALESAPGSGASKADTRAISSGLLETLGVRLIAGRFFTDDERPEGRVVIVDELLAQHLWPGRSAVGQHLYIGQATPDERATVVGVVQHLRLRSLVEDLSPQIFIPYRSWQRSPMAYVVGTDRDPSTIAGDVRAAVAALDPHLPIYDVRPMASYVAGARSVRRFTVLLAAVFAVSALALTSIGIYGVLAYSVAVRRHEFGVRRALGADTAQVMRDVLREGLGLAAAGLVAGLAGAAVAASLLQSQLYGVDARDPVTYGAALTLILGSAILACWIPARRAAATSPLDAMMT